MTGNFIAFIIGYVFGMVFLFLGMLIGYLVQVDDKRNKRHDFTNDQVEAAMAKLNDEQPEGRNADT